MRPPCDLLCVPSAFTYPTGSAHWEVLLRARAIENQCYVVAAAQGGRHENGRRTFGHSMVVDPWGEVVRDAARRRGHRRRRAEARAASPRCARNCRRSSIDGPSEREPATARLQPCGAALIFGAALARRARRARRPSRSERAMPRPGGAGRLRRRRPHRREVECARRGPSPTAGPTRIRALPHLRRRCRRQPRAARHLCRLARRPAPVPGGVASGGRVSGDAGREERARATIGRCDAGLRRLHRLLARQRATARAPGSSTSCPTATTTRSRTPRFRPTARSSSGPSGCARRASSISISLPAPTSSRSPISSPCPSRIWRTCEASGRAMSSRAARSSRWPPTTRRSPSTAPTSRRTCSRRASTR